MSADSLSAALDGMRRRARQITDEHAADDCDRDGETCTGHDAELLLAAVDAVLAHHQPQPGMFPPTCFACAAWDEDAEETVEACWPCPTYLAISRALLGPEGPEGASG